LSLPQTHDGTVASAPDLVGTACEGVTFDGAAFPNVISGEDRYSRVKCSLYGVQYVSIVGPDGSTDTLQDVLTKLDEMMVVYGEPDAGTSISVGYWASSHGSSSSVDLGDRVTPPANREGIPFVVSGHPNMRSVEAQVQDADGAQTDQLLATCGSGCKMVVTRASMKCDGSNTGPVNAVIGLGTANVPARAHTGVNGIVAAFDGIPAGGGSVEGNGGGMLVVGGDGEDIRYTMEDPAGGACSIAVSYYTTAS
jgi:hypothetical protein